MPMRPIRPIGPKGLAVKPTADIPALLTGEAQISARTLRADGASVVI